MQFKKETLNLIFLDTLIIVKKVSIIKECSKRDKLCSFKFSPLFELFWVHEIVHSVLPTLRMTLAGLSKMDSSGDKEVTTGILRTSIVAVVAVNTKRESKI